MNGMFKIHQPLFEGEGGNGDGGGNSDDGKKDDDKELTFDQWYEKQDDQVKELVDGHTKGLKSALDSERGNRQDLEKSLRDLAKKAEEGSEAQKKLTEMADQIQTADRKADFYEAAHAAGVTNLKLAYIVAEQDGLFDSKGRVNFESMKKDYPELFGKKVTEGDAGGGTDGEPKGKAGMNAFIRRAAGRQET